MIHIIISCSFSCNWEKSPFLPLFWSHDSSSSYSIYQWISYRLYQWRSHKWYQLSDHNCHHRPKKANILFFYFKCYSFSSSSINRHNSSSDSTNSVIYISSFEMNKVNPFPAFTTPCPLVFLSNTCNTDEVALVC